MDMSPVIQAQLALTSLFMLMGTLCNAGILFTLKTDASTKTFNRIATLVTTFAFINYFGMALGHGSIEVHGRSIYFLRYVDWLCTTPLMLFELCSIAGADISTWAVLLVLDVSMILGGLGAAMSSPSSKWPLFMVSIMAFVFIVVKLFKDLSKKAQELGGSSEVLFNFVASRTVEIWCAYPVLFALCECTNTLSEEVEVASYAITDVMAKCGIPLMVWVSAMSGKSSALPTLLTADPASDAVV
eukprot:TRINITY_DN110643_c0_g1_i1.p1 TRINITY_DN110643_c0_g1~~TRINITY_DN110643_c0_g1_i1.p1  ORF type:complete len:243 (+),score=47.71 TRINITY_DN110643_c0_g1_i1:66-794(+)